ncbi:Flagellin protein FlaA [Chitinispirillum alkaliphilum]|nr:Flagellin protein FlaA [Chitinispirillum alkaliphilum]
MFVDSLSLAVSRIGSHYNTSRKGLSVSLERLSTGRRFEQPRDGIGDFIRIQRIRQDRRDYDEISKNLSRATAILNVAESAGMEVVNNFQRLKEITELYHMRSTTDENRSLYELEFDTLLVNMNTIKNTISFDGKQLIQHTDTVARINLDPHNPDSVLEIRFDESQMFDTSGLSINSGGSKETAMQAIEEQMGKAMLYLGQTSGFMRSVNTQTELIGSVVENGHAYESTLGSINEVEELSKMVTHDMRQQASISMLMHANVARQAILKLLG